ncbi:RNA polymerase sigma factor SigF, partial [Amorphoplanes nipponensis]
MTAVTIKSTTASDVPASAGAAAETAGELLARLAATPAGDRRRRALRDRAIEAWLPLARHLAHR